MKNILSALFIVICLTGSSCNEKHQKILKGVEVDTGISTKCTKFRMSMFCTYNIKGTNDASYNY